VLAARGCEGLAKPGEVGRVAGTRDAHRAGELRVVAAEAADADALGPQALHQPVANTKFAWLGNAAKPSACRAAASGARSARTAATPAGLPPRASTRKQSRSDRLLHGNGPAAPRNGVTTSGVPRA
jgi:hypothetical protein